MSWSRFDDNWTRKIRALRLEFQTRWHYLEMIQFVSGSDTFESPIRPVDARTCSDVDDPLACLAELEDKGLVMRDEAGDYVMVRIAEHIPSEQVRDRTTAEREKKRRQRAHAKGDHGLCSFPACPATVPGTVPGTSRGPDTPEQPCPANVPGTVGTGQDGPGLEGLAVDHRTGELEDEPESWGPLPSSSGRFRPCSICTSTTGDCRCFDEMESA